MAAAVLQGPNRRGLTLLALVPVFAVLTLGLAFTVFGEIAALLAVVSLVAGLVILARSRRARQRR